MKRFLVFCSIILVVVALGYTVVFFLKDTEKLNVPATLYQLNVGETNTLEWKLEKAKNSTTVEYEIADTSIVSLDEKTKKLTALKGGATTITIVTSNKNIGEVTVEINVGDGSKEYPYYIRNAGDLVSIGSQTVTQENINPFRVEDSYILVSDIDLSGAWQPIKGNFTGIFYGEGHVISGLSVTGTMDNVGLFETIGEGGGVQYLTFDGANISGAFANAGIVTGTNSGDIKNVHVINSSVTNTFEGGYTGAICGQNLASGTTASNISKTSVSCAVKGKGSVGGITGVNMGGYVYNTYTKESTTVTNESATGVAGGIVGVNTESGDTFSVVKDCYSLATISSANTSVGAIVGQHHYDGDKDPKVLNLVVGCYYQQKEGLVGVAGYNDLEPSTSQDDQFAYGVMGVAGKTLNELRVQSNFVSHVSKSTKRTVAWDFNEAWKLENNSTPSINEEGANIKLSLGSLNIGGKTLIDGDALSKINMNGVYIIENDIDLKGAEWTPLSGQLVTPSGSTKVGFSGYLSGVWLEDEQRYTKIYNFKLSDGENVGFFDTIEATGEVCYLGFEAVSTPTQNGANVRNFGVVAGVNKGNIHDVNVGGDSVINLNGKDKTVNAGAVSGVNDGVITKVAVDGVNLSNIVDNIDVPTYVGGITGVNHNYVSYCSVSSSDILRKSTFYGAIGGIVGLNEKSQTSTPTIKSNYVTQSGITASYSFTGKPVKAQFSGHLAGGIVGLTYGPVFYNAFDSTVNGFVVGGIAGYVRGMIYENQTTTNALMKGCIIGGVAGYQQGKEGETDIFNNSVEGSLMGVEYNSSNDVGVYGCSGNGTYKAGIVAGSGTIWRGGPQPVAYNNFVSVNYQGNGPNHKDTFGFVNEGALKRWNNVYNTTLVKNIDTNVVEDAASWIWSNVGYFFIPGTQVKFSEGNASETEITGSDYKLFKKHGFSDSIWCLDATINDKFPVLYNVVKIPTAEDVE